MRSAKLLIVSGAALLALSACDFIRFPGDGGPPPETPEPGPAIPPGAPGPPPPTAPVEDPYGSGDQAETPDDTDLPAPPSEDTDTQDPVSDETGEDTAEDPASDLDADPVDDASPETDDPDETDTPEAPDTETDDTPEDSSETPASEEPGAEPEDTSDAEPDTETPTQPDPVSDTDTVEPAFSYYEAGALLPGSGQGAPDQIVYAPDMVFPIAEAPAYLQSQVFSFGGGVAGGDQCDARNYTYPWRDNFCEVRSANRNSPYCPQNKVHQGQDIRVGSAESCNTIRRTPAAERTFQKVVAVEDGIISHVGTYSVNLRAGGRIYKYMHMNMNKLQVKAGDSVKAGDHIGYVSNDFGGTPTTFHLHFEITQNGGNGQWVHVPPYLSLVKAYERREDGPGEAIEAPSVGVASAAFVIPEGMEIIE